MPPSSEAIKTTAGSRSTSERYFNSSLNGLSDSDWPGREFKPDGPCGPNTPASMLSVASALTTSSVDWAGCDGGSSSCLGSNLVELSCIGSRQLMVAGDTTLCPCPCPYQGSSVSPGRLFV